MEQASGCVSIEVACKALASKRAMRAIIRETLGPERAVDALSLMHNGDLEGDLGAEIHDLVADAITNSASVVWTGLIQQEHDDYPVSVHHFHGVYWVWAIEYEPVGYFLDQSSAVDFVKWNWEGVNGRPVSKQRGRKS